MKDDSHLCTRLRCDNLFDIISVTIIKSLQVEEAVGEPLGRRTAQRHLYKVELAFVCLLWLPVWDVEKAREHVAVYCIG